MKTIISCSSDIKCCNRKETGLDFLLCIKVKVCFCGCNNLKSVFPGWSGFMYRVWNIWLLQLTGVYLKENLRFHLVDSACVCGSGLVSVLWLVGLSWSSIGVFVSSDVSSSAQVSRSVVAQVQDRLAGCWVRMWLWRRVTEENLFPHSEQRNAEPLLGGDEGEEVSAAALSAACVWRWALRSNTRLNLRPHSSHSDQTLRRFFCTHTHRNLINQSVDQQKTIISSLWILYYSFTDIRLSKPSRVSSTETMSSDISHVHTDVCRTGFSFFAPFKWN